MTASQEQSHCIPLLLANQCGLIRPPSWHHVSLLSPAIVCVQYGKMTVLCQWFLAILLHEGQLRGRTSERGLEQPPVPRDPKMPQPPTSRGLMTRRTFNLPRAESPVPIPEGPPTRAPRAPGDVRPLASTMMRQVPHRPPRPLAATFQEGESTELPRRRHRSTSVTPPGEASASASRAGSEGEGPTRSILRSSNSRERSHQKRVSFSNDCKRAPPASMADLIRTCPDDLDKRETSPSSPSLGDLRCVNAKQDTPHLQLIQRQLLLLKPSLKNRSWDEAKEKAANVVSELNWNELNALLRGEHFAMTGSPDEGYYVGNIRGVSRLGIPALKMQDAAQGFRATQPNTGGTTTAFPCMLALASTWDEDLVALVAAAIATEFKGKGANVILGPSVNVHRGATGGRNFEYLSGEDPHLGFRLTAAYVKAVQELRRRETNRMTMDAKASERTGMELYLAPFRGAVAAGVGAFMCAYNKVNHTYACHNAELLTKDLRGIMGFQGFDALAAGLDQEQPGIIQLPLGNKVGVLIDKEINKVDRKELLSDQTKATTRGQRHEDIAFHAAASSVILLKNDGVLPLKNVKRTRSAQCSGKTCIAAWILVLGEAAVDEAHNSYIGKGSGYVQPDSSAKTPLAAIEEPLLFFSKNPPVVIGWQERAAKANITVVRPDSHSPAEAKSLSGTVDAIIVVLGLDATEGADRSSLELGPGSEKLVRAAASKAPTIVLLQIPGAVLMPWKSEVGAIASIFMGGVATGAAWASFIFGDTPPKGRLPIMMPETANDTVQIGKDAEVDYAEELGLLRMGLLTSYRSPHFKAAFPFGHGLTYTTFEFSDAQQTHAGCEAAACVAVTVRNTGQVAGEEVVQAYVHFPEPTGGDEPRQKFSSCVAGITAVPGRTRMAAKALKGFKRTSLLKPNEMEIIELKFTTGDFSLDTTKVGLAVTAICCHTVPQQDSRLRRASCEPCWVAAQYSVNESCGGP
eukprot:s57_g2.t2